MGLILILAVFVIYLPVWRAGFIWDDDAHVTANPCIVGPLGLKEIWTTGAAQYYPLVLTTFWVEHALWGLAPLPYHLVNVLMHGACAVLLWRVLRSLQVMGAWLGAALWALHPVQVETVSWVTELKNTQSCLFYLLSILFFVRWLKSRVANDRNGGGYSYALALLCAALAMASKSSTVVLPVVLCLCAWWVEGRWQWRNVARVGPVFLMLAISAVVSIWTQNLDGAYDLQSVRSWPERLVTAGDEVWFYLGKLAWPHPLIFIYPRWEIDAGQWISYLPLLAAMMVLIILWLYRESWSRPYFFTFSYFLIALLPVLGLVDHYFLRYSFVGDHFQYLASMGPLALAGSAMTRLADFVIPQRYWLQASLCSGLLLLTGMLSWRQAWVYESLDTLWTDTLAQNPHCWMAYNNLGVVLEQKGQVDEAMEQYQKALQINPTYTDAYNNLGLVFAKKGQVDEAVALYKKALEINPNFAQVHNSLGVALEQKGQIDEAIEQYQKALQINPNFADAHNNLGLVFAQKGQVDEAIEQYQKALQINPNFAGARCNLGVAFFQKGQMDEAMAQFQKALEINPNYAEAHNNLGIALAQKGQIDEAMVQYQKALEIDPTYTKAHNNLGNILLQKGQVDEAIAQFQKALEINPNFAEVHNSLGAALFQKGQLDEAIAQFQEALRLQPDNTGARNNLVKVRAVMQQRITPK